MTQAGIVETNVIVVANMKSEQAGADCVLACVDALETARKKQIVSIDAGMRFFDEYFRHASRSGQPGLGDMFIKWLWDNQAYPKHCEQVAITPKADDAEDFEEFPCDPALTRFDRADRKFAAVACASRYAPHILNATDSDWWNFRGPLEGNSIFVEFLCPSLMIRER